MSALMVEQAIEEIYTSLHNGNADIDTHIGNLKQALNASGQKEAVFESARLAQNNRQGRKMMQTYFVDREEPEKARSGGDKCVNLGAGFCQETRFLGSIPGKIKFGIHANRKL
jgi:hypothetical protein